jgi:predicted DNA-binding transcriptional regulator YafY
LRLGSIEWLIGEILSHRGEAEVLEPQKLRREVRDGAKALGAALKPRARAGSR